MLVKLTCDNPEHLERGVEKLISYGPLLDLVDTKYKSVGVVLNVCIISVRSMIKEVCLKNIFVFIQLLHIICVIYMMTFSDYNIIITTYRELFHCRNHCYCVLL